MLGATPALSPHSRTRPSKCFLFSFLKGRVNEFPFASLLPSYLKQAELLQSLARSQAPTRAPTTGRGPSTGTVTCYWSRSRAAGTPSQALQYETSAAALSTGLCASRDSKYVFRVTSPHTALLGYGSEALYTLFPGRHSGQDTQGRGLCT